MSENAANLSERALEDQRNRFAVQALLALKDQTLMSVLRELPHDFPEKMDYANTAAWMRGTSGRFGIKKQRALLKLLGYVDGHLDTSRNHVWFPTLENRFDPEKYEAIKLAVKVLFKNLVNDAPYHKAYLKTPEGLTIGMAVNFAGATVIFPVTSGITPLKISMWLSTIERWHQIKSTDIEINRQELDDCLAGSAILDFWGKQRKREIPDQWVELVDRFIELGISPAEVWTWVQANVNVDR